MDPLSMVANISGLVALGAKISSHAYNFIEGTRSANPDILQISTDLNSISQLLAQLQTSLKSGKGKSKPFPAEVGANLEGILESCEVLLDRMSDLMGQYDGVSESMRLRMKWNLFGEADALKLGRMLAAEKQTLNLVLMWANSITTSSIKQGMERTETNTRQMIAKMQDFEHKLDTKYLDAVPADMQFTIKNFLNSASAYSGSTLGDEDALERAAEKLTLDEVAVANQSSGANNNSNGAADYARVAVHKPTPSAESEADALVKLGDTYKDEQKVSMAILMYKQALQRYRTIGGTEGKYVLNRCYNYGVAKRKADATSNEAVELLEFALAGYEEMGGRQDQDALDCCLELAILFHDQGKLDKGKDMYQRTFEGFKMNGAELDTSFATKCYELGDRYKAKGQHDNAVTMYLLSREEFESTGKGHDPDALDCLVQLGWVYNDQEKLEKAKNALQKADEGFEARGYGANHYGTISAAHYNLGLAYRKLSEWSNAEHEFKRAWKGYEKCKGAKHEDTLDSIWGLGKVYVEQKEYTKAGEMQALAIRNGHAGSDMGDCYDLGIAAWEKKRFADAKGLLQCALAGYVAQGDRGRKMAYHCHYFLGRAAEDCHKYAAAICHMAQAVEGYKAVFGIDHSQTTGAITQADRIRTKWHEDGHAPSNWEGTVYSISN